MVPDHIDCKRLRKASQTVSMLVVNSAYLIGNVRILFENAYFKGQLWGIFEHFELMNTLYFLSLLLLDAVKWVPKWSKQLYNGKIKKLKPKMGLNQHMVCVRGVAKLATASDNVNLYLSALNLFLQQMQSEYRQACSSWHHTRKVARINCPNCGCKTGDFIIKLHWNNVCSGCEIIHKGSDHWRELNVKASVKYVNINPPSRSYPLKTCLKDGFSRREIAIHIPVIN